MRSSFGRAGPGGGDAPARSGLQKPPLGADQRLFSVTLHNDRQLDRDMLEAYRAFRLEAEPKGFRHFLEEFCPMLVASTRRTTCHAFSRTKKRFWLRVNIPRLDTCLGGLCGLGFLPFAMQIVAAGLFRDVQRFVGTLKQRLGRIVLNRQGHTHAKCYGNALTVESHVEIGRGDRLSDAVRDFDSPARIGLC